MPAGGCDSTKPIVWAVPKPPEVAEILGVSVPYYHRPCEHNEFVSLHNRVLSPPYEPTKVGKQTIRHAMTFLVAFGMTLSLMCLSRLTFVKSITIPGKRKMYERALQFLEEWGFMWAMGMLSSFIKIEPVDGEVKGSTDPRMIQARSPEFNIEFGRYFKPIEHILLKLDWSKVFPWAPKGRLIAKGLNNVQRGKLIVDKAKQFKHFACMGVDASRFDQSVSKPWLLLCHAFYLSCYNFCSTLRYILSFQLMNRGRTKNGVKYQADGGRASGDQDTGGGNSLITVVMITMYFEKLNILWDMICDGDDALIFVERENLHHLDGFVDYCREVGFKMACEQPVTRLSDIEFCQCHPIEVIPGKYVMVRKPVRALSRAGMSNTSFATITEAAQTLWAIGACELALGTGVPVMQEFALWCLRNGVKPRERKLNLMKYRLSYQYWHLPKSNSPRKVTPSARASFAEAFGISPGEQVTLEKAFRNHNFILTGRVVTEEPYDAGAGPVYVDSHSVYNRRQHGQVSKQARAA